MNDIFIPDIYLKKTPWNIKQTFEIFLHIILKSKLIERELVKILHYEMKSIFLKQPGHLTRYNFWKQLVYRWLITRKRKVQVLSVRAFINPLGFFVTGFHAGFELSLLVPFPTIINYAPHPLYAVHELNVGFSSQN